MRTERLRSQDSSIETGVYFADGGNIHLQIGTSMELVNSQISATVKSGFGSGGNIVIDPRFVILNNSQNHCKCVRWAWRYMRMIADVLLASPDTVISASSALNTPGLIDIQAPITDLTGSLTPLPETIVQATALLRQSCAARLQQRQTE